MPKSATSTVWSLTPSIGGCSLASASARLSAVRWWHSWCRVRSLGLRTSRLSTRYTAQPSVGRTATGRNKYGNVPPWSCVQCRRDPVTDDAVDPESPAPCPDGLRPRRREQWTAVAPSETPQVLERLSLLRQHQQDGRRSPHKPLLVLLALGRLVITGSSSLP